MNFTSARRASRRPFVGTRANRGTTAASLVLAVVGGLGIGLPSRALLLALGAATIALAIAYFRQSLFWPAVVGALAAPVFVDIEQRRLALLDLLTLGAESGQGLHLGFVVAAAVAAGALLRGISARSLRASTGRWLVATLVAALTASYLASVVTRATDPLSFVFYAQTVAPVLAFVAASQTRISRDRFVVLFLRWITASLILIELYAFIRLASGEPPLLVTNRLARGIPQFRNYLPMVITMAAALAVTHLRVHRGTARLALVAIVSFLPIMWSRAGLAMIAVAATVAWTYRHPDASPDSVMRTRVSAAGVFVVASLLAIAISSLGTLGSRVETTQFATYDERRLDLAIGGLERIAEDPIFGVRYEPEWETFAGGQVANFRRLYHPHNQYIDYGLRGGIAAAIAFIALLAHFVRRSWILARKPSEHQPFHAGLLGVLAAVVLGSFSQIFFVQPYTGVLLWFLLGLSARPNAVAGFRAQADTSPGDVG